MDIEKVAIRGCPAFTARRGLVPAAKELSPKRLRVRSPYPPRGSICILARALRGHGVAGFLGERPGSINSQTRPMEVQIFGVKKSADTRKALRFFSERRVKTHFVDLNERAASTGELKRFVQKFGLDKLIDREAKRFDELGLRHARLSDDRWLEKLVDEPLLLRMPLVRFGNALTIGPAETDWKSWTVK